MNQDNIVEFRPFFGHSGNSLYHQDVSRRFSDLGIWHNIITKLLLLFRLQTTICGNYFKCTKDGKIHIQYLYKPKFTCNYRYPELKEYLPGKVFFMKRWGPSEFYTSCDFVDDRYLEDLVSIDIYQSPLDLSHIPNNLAFWIHDGIDYQDIVWPDSIKRLGINTKNDVVDLIGMNIDKVVANYDRSIPRIIYNKVSCIKLFGFTELPTLVGPPTNIEINDKPISWDDYLNKTETIPGMTKSARSV